MLHLLLNCPFYLYDTYCIVLNTVMFYWSYLLVMFHVVTCIILPDRTQVSTMSTGATVFQCSISGLLDLRTNPHTGAALIMLC